MFNSKLMDIMERRRSIRVFKNEPILKEDILELLKGAILAPTASNIQPWIFGIISDEKVLEKISTFSPGLNGKPPCLIVVCSNRKLAYEKGGELGRDELALMDVTMAAENIILLATERGLGTCAIKSFNVEAIKRILNLPEHISPDLILTIGYAKNHQKSPPKKKLEEVIFYNKWEDKVI